MEAKSLLSLAVQFQIGLLSPPMTSSIHSLLSLFIQVEGKCPESDTRVRVSTQSEDGSDWKHRQREEKVTAGRKKTTKILIWCVATPWLSHESPRKHHLVTEGLQADVRRGVGNSVPTQSWESLYFFKEVSKHVNIIDPTVGRRCCFHSRATRAVATDPTSSLAQCLARSLLTCPQGFTQSDTFEKILALKKRENKTISFFMWAITLHPYGPQAQSCRKNEFPN